MLRDAWENITTVCRSIWAELPPDVRAFLSGMGIGAVCGTVLTWLVF